MATGVSSGAWGYSPRMVGDMNTPFGDDLSYQLSLTSKTPTGDMVSPLTTANKNWYSVNFGKKKYKDSEFNYLKKQLKLK